MVVGKIKEQKQETISHWLEDRLGVRGGNYNKFSFDSEGLGECFGQAHRRLSNSADPRTLKVHLSFLWKRKRGNWGETAELSRFSSPAKSAEEKVSPVTAECVLAKLTCQMSFETGSHHWDTVSVFSGAAATFPVSGLFSAPPAHPSYFKDASENLPGSLAGSTRAPYCPAVLRRTAGFLITAARHDEAQIHNLWVARSIISHRRIL